MMVLSGGHGIHRQRQQRPSLPGARTSPTPRWWRNTRFVTRYGSALFGYINGEQNAKAFSAQLGQPPVYAGRCLWGMNPEVTGNWAPCGWAGPTAWISSLTMGIERPSYAVTPEVFTSRNRSRQGGPSPGVPAVSLQLCPHRRPPTGRAPQWEPWDNSGGRT